MASKEIQEIVDNLTVMDDTFFHKLTENMGFCEELIQTILGKKSIRLIEATAQKSLRNIKKGRSVILDAYCVDIEKTNYDIEIQEKDNDDHQKRVRYNGSNMDTYIADKGIKFNQIPNAYVIYISKNDFFGQKKTIYHVDRILRETKKIVNNGFYEIYVNTQIDDGSDVAELMKIFKSTEIPKNIKFPRICSEIKNLKIGKGRDTMCAIVEEYAEKKAKETAKETALHLLKIGKLTIEEIVSSIPLLSTEEVIELQKLL